MNTGSSSPFGNAHRDVLDPPIPDTDEGKNRLLEELKTRGRSAVQAGHWPDAEALYKKGLDCCCVDNNSNNNNNNNTAMAILHANLSLVQGKMNHWNDAQKNGQQATELDPSYTKGWWRLGQAQSALYQYEEAVTALEEAYRLEPNNTALNKELMNLRQKAAEAAVAQLKAQEETATTAAATTKTTTTVRKQDSKDDKSLNKKQSNTTSAEPMQVDDDDDDTTAFTKSEPVKGYKIVNGKKTSYFHNELSEEAAKLIGDIAPKKLNANAQDDVSSNGGTRTTAGATTNAASAAAEGTSAWNKAGTWEEKDVTSWAIDSLQNQLLAVQYTFPDSSPAPQATVQTRKATVTGHASVATVRGKKRFIYEFIVKLEWEFFDAQHGHDAHGILNFPDFDGTCSIGEGYEASNFEIKHSDTANSRQLLETFVHKQGWRIAIHDCMDNWVRIFKETF